MIVSGFRVALDLDTYPISYLILPRCVERAKPGRGKPVLIMHIGFFDLFSHHISRTQSFQRNRHIIFLALVALKLLVSLISRLVACSVFTPYLSNAVVLAKSSRYFSCPCSTEAGVGIAQ